MHCDAAGVLVTPAALRLVLETGAARSAGRASIWETGAFCEVLIFGVLPSDGVRVGFVGMWVFAESFELAATATDVTRPGG